MIDNASYVTGIKGWVGVAISDASDTGPMVRYDYRCPVKGCSNAMTVLSCRSEERPLCSDHNVLMTNEGDNQ